MNGDPQKRRSRPSALRRLVIASLGCACTFTVTPALAQLMRMGPFDVSPSMSLEGVYTTNIEGQRKSEQELEAEDYFLVFGFGTAIDGKLSEDWFIGTDLGFDMERHLNRPDLDTESLNDFFGNINFVNQIERGHYTFLLQADYVRRREVEEDTFITGSIKTRNPHSEYGFGADVVWKVDELTLGVGYLFSRTEFDEEEASIGDVDDQTINAFLEYRINSRVKALYNFESARSDFPNDPENEGDGIWLETETAGLEFEVIPDRSALPKTTYFIGVERVDQVDEQGKWQLTQRIGVSEEWDLTGTLRLSAAAEYSIQEEPAEDAVDFTYNLTLDHTLSRTAAQSLSLTRSPRRTFGSTQDTDSTTVAYVFEKSQFLVKELTLSLSVDWTHDQPPEGETEEGLTYGAGLFHTRNITRRISRTLAYDYYYETLNTEDEALEEHRVTLTFGYAF